MTPEQFDAYHADMVSAYTLDGGNYHARDNISKSRLRRLFTESFHRARARLIMRDVLAGELTTGEIALKYDVAPSVVSNIIAGRQQRDATTTQRAAYRLKPCKPTRSARLSDALVREIYTAYHEGKADGCTQMEIARRYGLGQRLVQRIVTGSHYASVTQDLRAVLRARDGVT